jgi:transcriptional regulator with XRE-family HTH domain
MDRGPVGAPRAAHPMTPATLRAWRHAHGWTQDHLARALGVHRATLLRWEAGQTKPPEFLGLALRELEGETAPARIRKPRQRQITGPI